MLVCLVLASALPLIVRQPAGAAAKGHYHYGCVPLTRQMAYVGCKGCTVYSALTCQFASNIMASCMDGPVPVHLPAQTLHRPSTAAASL